jgi:hypothetical protein
VHELEDELVVAAQLGRKPRGEWSVASRCHLGVPMVIKNHPVLEDGSPFPTLYWLTCPILVKRVGALESEGFMELVNTELKSNLSIKDRLADALNWYRVERDSLAEVESDAPGGGAERVKCLHAHTAHELASPPNPVGAISLARAGWPDCREPCHKAVK